MDILPSPSGSGLQLPSSTDSSAVSHKITPTSLPDDKLNWFLQDFRPKFNQWVFDPIDRLIEREPLVSFIVMACAIDYLGAYKRGSSTIGKVGEAYIDFINDHFPPGYSADDLYKSLRNGLVHLFTIKQAKYALTHGQPSLHLTITPATGQVVLNASSFRDDLVTARDNYFSCVESQQTYLDKLVESCDREGVLGRITL